MPGVGKANTVTSAAAGGDTLTSSDQASRSLAQAARPYPPSWVDRLTGWVDRLPGPAWPYYAGVALVLILARAAVGWSDGSYAFGDFFPVHVLAASTAPYLAFALGFLNSRAEAALADFRPVLTTDHAGYERLRYQLTNMPARPVLLLSVLGFAFGFFGSTPGLLLPEAQVRLLKLFTSPATGVVDHLLLGLNWMWIAVGPYYVFHKLPLVSRIYTQHTRVNIFGTSSLHALSRVGAIMTLTLSIILYLYLTYWINWQLDNPSDAVVILISIPIAFMMFVWPLLGAHRLLEKERTRRKSQVAQRLEAVTDELHRRTDAGDYSDMASMNDAIDSLIKEQNALDKVSTWPWEPDTVRAVVTALLLPVVLWAVTRVLERLGF
jgi:hypothetical protein